MVAGNWYNSDGLYLEFGTTKPANETAGTYRTTGELREIECTLDVSTLTSTAGGTIISNGLKFPDNVRVQEIEVVTQTACCGSGAVLNFGLIKEDRSTEIDNDGFLAVYPLANCSTAGATTVIRQGSSFVGALVGSEVSSANGPGYLVGDWDTAAFTGGILRIKIRYYANNVISQ